MSNNKKNTTGNAKVKSNDMQLNFTIGIESGNILTIQNEKLDKWKFAKNEYGRIFG